jgi:hypothetical protein
VARQQQVMQQRQRQAAGLPVLAAAGKHLSMAAQVQKVQYKPRHDNLILVGDLVNKGPKSQQVSSTLCATNTGAAPTTQHEAGRMCYLTVFMGSQHEQQRSW